MKNLILSLIAILVFSGKAWASFSSGPYFPIQSGNSWTYEVDGSCCSTTTVLEGTTDVNGVPTKALDDTDGFTNYLTNDADGIRLHRQFEPEVFIPGMSIVDLTATFIPPIKIADAVTDIGQTVNSTGIARTNDLPGVGVLDLLYSARFTVEAFESITVPAGNFHVVRLRGTITIDGEVASSTIYAARNIGIVKDTETPDFLSFIAFTINSILQIPRPVPLLSLHQLHSLLPCMAPEAR